MTKRIIDQLRPGMMVTVFWRRHPKDKEFAGQFTMEVKHVLPEVNGIYARIDRGKLTFVDMEIFSYWDIPDIKNTEGRRYELVFCERRLMEFDLDEKPFRFGMDRVEVVSV
jgi:hypothetical protein